MTSPGRIHLLLPMVEKDAPWAAKTVSEFGYEVASSEGYSLGFAANEHPPRLRSHDRSGQPDRHCRVPPGMARTSPTVGRSWPALAAMGGRSRARKSSGPHGSHFPGQPDRSGPLLSNLDDLRGDSRASTAARTRELVGAEDRRPALRPGVCPSQRKARTAPRAWG